MVQFRHFTDAPASDVSPIPGLTEYRADGLQAVAGRELAQDVLDVVADRCSADAQEIAYLPGASSFREKTQYPFAVDDDPTETPLLRSTPGYGPPNPSRTLRPP